MTLTLKFPSSSSQAHEDKKKKAHEDKVCGGQRWDRTKDTIGTAELPVLEVIGGEFLRAHKQWIASVCTPYSKGPCSKLVLILLFRSGSCCGDWKNGRKTRSSVLTIPKWQSLFRWLGNRLNPWCFVSTGNFFLELEFTPGATSLHCCQSTSFRWNLWTKI